MNNSQSLIDFKPKNIIIRMPNWLGDCVMATPILADLHTHWPDAKITAMCQEPVAALLEQDPHIHSIFHLKQRTQLFGKDIHDRVLLPLRKGSYDLGILLTNSFSSALSFYRGHVRHRVGFSTHARSFLLNYPIPFPEHRDSQHLTLTYKALLEPFGIPISNTLPKLYLTEEERKQAALFLANLGIQKKDFIIGINPGAAFGSAKCWLPDRFKELTRQLLKLKRMKVIFFGDRAGAHLVNEICSEFSEGVINLAGKTTLRELPVLIEACNLFLTNDSGPMHVASSLNVPLIALFGSTNEITTGPYRGEKVIHKHVPCSPCYRRTCPIDFRCMTQITVEEVYSEIQKLIKSMGDIVT